MCKVANARCVSLQTAPRAELLVYYFGLRYFCIRIPHVAESFREMCRHRTPRAAAIRILKATNIRTCTRRLPLPVDMNLCLSNADNNNTAVYSSKLLVTRSRGICVFFILNYTR